MFRANGGITESSREPITTLCRFHHPAQLPPLLFLPALLILGSAEPAFADPCTAPLPAKGTTFSGVVRYVGDGDSLCVGPPGRPDRWIEVRLGDHYAPELHEARGKDAKLRLERTAMGKPLTCRAGSAAMTV